LFREGLKGAKPLLKNYLPSSLMKGRGIKGERLVNNISRSVVNQDYSNLRKNCSG
jgi:hypothetical protein